ncbi:hypothetical protein T4A_13934 [Trichinella pseudospiralis]|uniref:Uncharacterized protein n=1 Tax=Trichinella pseudospiralis TaxID=6337 RepID=A0A0V1EDF8_TRIPS|nr:hypothetical protein T4A_13934 [Trichinella pseudospiralis]
MDDDDDDIAVSDESMANSICRNIFSSRKKQYSKIDYIYALIQDILLISSFIHFLKSFSKLTVQN